MALLIFAHAQEIPFEEGSTCQEYAITVGPKGGSPPLVYLANAKFVNVEKPAVADVAEVVRQLGEGFTVTTPEEYLRLVKHKLGPR